ncbi:lamin tail domain-containing protein [Streptomyces actuosus]|uniref:Lamin tail domain-containing protein n=1 Tax=Streptomyces actuosus TaxID=1885 RepID=A0ABS2VJ74_STRAS|nr:lamin tail domain-containing protein [Streptomyces actuosus]MBN0043139.1 lamin tail domain-containing protein [Streptomyces actuosus]
MTAVATVTAAALGAVALPASAADHHHGHGHHPDVYISAVQADPPGRDNRSNRSLNKEWVDITNSTRRAVNLNNWTLKNEDGRTYTFHHYRLAARTTVRVHTGTGHDSRTHLFQNRRTYVWDNHRDTATLRNNHGRFVDDAAWGHHHGHHGHHGNRH